MAGTVTVASKLPMALVLHLEEAAQTKESSPLGHLDVTRYRRLPKAVTINGVARRFGEASDVQLSNGCALTHGVDADFWDKWLAGHRDYAPVERGLLFAVPKPGDVATETRNIAKEKSGFEPVDPSNLPAEFTSGVATIAKL